MTSRVTCWWIVCFVLTANLATAQTPLDTAFSYQGRLSDGGGPANGVYDLGFRLYDAASGGSQIGTAVCYNDVVVANGLFTILLEFGAQFAGQERFLEIAVRGDTGLGCGNLAGFVTLTPRQPLTAAPNALFALNASTADNATDLNGQPAAFYLNATNINAGTLADARLSVGGDLLGPLSGSVVRGLRGNPVSNAAPSAGDYLRWSGVQWVPSVGAWPALPFSGSTSVGGTAFSVQNADSAANSGAIVGIGAPSGTTFGVSGFSASTAGYGVVGLATANSGTNYGGYFETQSPTGYATRGLATATSGGAYGGYFESRGPTGRGVEGFASASSGANARVVGISNSPLGMGIYGLNNSAAGYAGLFETSGSQGRAVQGIAQATTGQNVGVMGVTNSSAGVAVYGINNGTSGISGLFENAGTGGKALVASASASSGATFGLFAESTSPDGRAVQGIAQAATGQNCGVLGITNSGAGVAIYGINNGTSGVSGLFEHAGNDGTALKASASAASGTTYGLYAESASTDGIGVFGLASADSGATAGVFGQADAPFGSGVYGLNTWTWGYTNGVYGEADSPHGTGVYGRGERRGVEGRAAGEEVGAAGVAGISTGLTGILRGVYGTCSSEDGEGVYGSGPRTGVHGQQTDYLATGLTRGVWGDASSMSGVGVYGANRTISIQDTPYGVYGECTYSATGFGVFASGDLGASGLKSFRIDHPSDPTNMHLLHYAMEGPQPYNIYKGRVTTDAQGYAWVQLPDYFEEINKDWDYQLTVVDDSDDFVQTKVTREVQDHRFQVRTSKPATIVCWEIKATRNDPYVRLKQPKDEVAKTGRAKGKYQHPELYGQPPEMGVDYEPRPELTPADGPPRGALPEATPGSSGGPQTPPGAKP